MPGPLLDHDRVNRLYTVHHAPQVDVDGAVPVREQQLVGLTADGDTGVVHHYVEAAVAVVSAAHQGRDRGGVADIKGRGRGSTRPLPGQPSGHTFRAVTVDVSHHDGVAPQNECTGQRPPDARRSPRNDHYPGHTCLPCT